MNSAEIIRTVRERAGMTQRQLAEKMGVTQSHVWKWEHGVSPTTDNFIAIIGACDHELIVKEKFVRGKYSEKGYKRR